MTSSWVTMFDENYRTIWILHSRAASTNPVASSSDGVNITVPPPFVKYSNLR